VHRPHAAAGGVDGDEGARGPKKTRQELIAERQAARNAALAKSGRGRAKMGGGDDEIDPMDPVSTQYELWAWCRFSIGADCLVAIAVMLVTNPVCLLRFLGVLVTNVHGEHPPSLLWIACCGLDQRSMAILA
jgi:hypothetical protein